jgi:hypothetical protein
MRPLKESNQGTASTVTPSSARVRMVALDHPRLRSDSHEACSRGGLDPGKSPTRTTRGRARQPLLPHLLTDKAFNTTTSTYMATAPPAWEQCQCLILPFTVHPEMDGKKLPLYTPRWALFYLRRPLRHNTTTIAFRVFWGSALSIPRQPPPLWLDRASSTASQQRNNARTLTTEDHMPTTGPRVFRRPITDITATP